MNTPSMPRNVMGSPEGLARLREPFPAHHISKLPKPTKKREEMDRLQKAHCTVCGGYHATSNVIHLDYVGHAALTDRLLDTDPAWTWEPLAMSPEGLPVLDGFGGMWIRLTVLGVTRLGYGHAGQKEGGDAIKEVIGDALRNAAMRFGAALELWHKGDLHLDKEAERKAELENLALDLIDMHKSGRDMDAIKIWYDVQTWNEDVPTANEERMVVWGLLKTESALRSAIKANEPDTALSRKLRESIEHEKAKKAATA